MPDNVGDTTNESLLWVKFLEGNTDAFETIIKLFYNDMYYYGLCFTKDVYLLKDAIQDIFLTLWKNRATIGKTTVVKFYLLKSLRRKLAEQINQGKKYMLKADTKDFDNLFELQLNKEDAIIHDETNSAITEQLRKAIKKLSKRQQEIIFLRFYNNAGFNEIADTMNLNHQSVYNLLHNAINRLKDITHKKEKSANPGINDLFILLLLAGCSKIFS